MKISKNMKAWIFGILGAIVILETLILVALLLPTPELSPKIDCLLDSRGTYMGDGLTSEECGEYLADEMYGSSYYRNRDGQCCVYLSKFITN